MSKLGIARRLVAVGGISAVVALGLGTTPAGATQVQVCSVGPIWYFNPPLTTQQQTGTVTTYWSALCVDASASGASGLEFPAGTSQFQYSCSCVSANLFGGTNVSGLLVGGVHATFTSPMVEEYVLDPANPCADGGPTSSVGGDANSN